MRAPPDDRRRTGSRARSSSASMPTATMPSDTRSTQLKGVISSVAGTDSRTRRLCRSDSPCRTFGLYDMLGNVAEWVDDCWTLSHEGARKVDGTPTYVGACTLRVGRGGAWGFPPSSIRAAYRLGFRPPTGWPMTSGSA